MKLSKKQKAYGILSIIVLLISLTVTLLDAFVKDFDLFVSFNGHEVLTFIFCVFVGFGLILLIKGFSGKSSFSLFLSGILIGLSFIYAFICLVDGFWWIGLIIVIVIWSILAILCVTAIGSKTEETDNKSPDYKDYETRKAEKEQAEANEKHELPQIKSFKDDNK